MPPWYDLVVEAGFPQPVSEVVDALEVIRYVLDLCWPELRIALEYDGYAAHEFRQDRDAQRDLDLQRRGRITVRATPADLRDPAELLDRLDQAFRSRGVPGCRTAQTLPVPGATRRDLFTGRRLRSVP